MQLSLLDVLLFRDFDRFANDGVLMDPIPAPSLARANLAARNYCISWPAQIP